MPIHYRREDARTFVMTGENTLEAKRQVRLANEVVSSGMVLVSEAAGRADTAAAQSRAWADGDTPPDPVQPESRSARQWAYQALTDGQAQTALSAASAQYSNAQAARADLAATQAAVLQPAFNSTAEGLAATTSDAIFTVRGAGDTFATTYRNDGGSASALAAFPSKSYMDGIAPAVNNKVIALARASGIDVANPGLDNGAAIRAAIEEAMTQGKTIDLGNNVFRVGSQWSTGLPITRRLCMRGDGAQFVAANGTRAKPFGLLRGPIEITGTSFNNFANLLLCDMEGIDIGENDVILRDIDHINAGGALIYTTREAFRIRNLVIESVNIDGPMNASGGGSGQGIRYQSNGFNRAYVRNVFMRNRSFQGIRVGGYPHGLLLNRNIHLESIHVDTVISNGQTNGIQAFGSDVYLNDLFVRNVDCFSGSSSNVEPVYVVGNRVNIGNVTIESGGNQQAALVIKSDKAKQHGPIRIRTHLHPRMSSAIRIDGSDAELRQGIDIEWLWEPIVQTTGIGTDLYEANYLHMDTKLSDTVSYHFEPHAANVTSNPTLDISGLGARPMVSAIDNSPIYPGQLRPGAIYRATYQVASNTFAVLAVNWERNLPLVPVADNSVRLDGTLTDGKVYWFSPVQTLTAGAKVAIGNSDALPVKGVNASGLVDEALSNGTPHAVFYSAADNAMISLFGSGKPYGGVGRFVPELQLTSANAYRFNHPYAEDYADGLFVLLSSGNTGPTTLNGEPLLKSAGEPATSGYFLPRVIYQLTRSGSQWLATRVGDSFPAIDVASGASGRQIIRNLTLTNTQYSTAISSYSSGHAEVSNIRTFGRTRLASSAVSFSLSTTAPIFARAFASDIQLSYYYGDNPSTVVTASAGFDLLNVEDLPSPSIRGVLGAQRGGIIGGTGIAGGIGKLRMRGVYRSPNNGALLPYASGFAAIDSDHVSEINNVNPPSLANGGFFEFSGSFTHLGVEPGDAVTVTHAANNTRLQFGGYATARDAVKLFVRDPNPAGAAIDLPAGKVYVTSRRLKD